MTDFDYGFSTISADDYAKLNAPQVQAPSTTTITNVGVDVDEFNALSHQVSQLFAMAQTLDDKLDIITQGLGIVQTTLSQDGIEVVPKDRLKRAVGVVKPLLEKLRDSHQQEMIKWPNRAPILQSMLNELEALTNL